MSVWSACAPHVLLVPVKARREHWLLLELELETVLSCCVDAGNRSWVLCKSNKGSKPQNHLSSPSVIFSKNRRGESSA